MCRKNYYCRFKVKFSGIISTSKETTEEVSKFGNCVRSYFYIEFEHCKFKIKRGFYHLISVMTSRRGWTFLFIHTSLSVHFKKKVIRYVLELFDFRCLENLFRRTMSFFRFKGLTFSFSLTEVLHVGVTLWTFRSGATFWNWNTSRPWLNPLPLLILSSSSSSSTERSEVIPGSLW